MSRSDSDMLVVDQIERGCSVKARKSGPCRLWIQTGTSHQAEANAVTTTARQGKAIASGRRAWRSRSPQRRSAGGGTEAQKPVGRWGRALSGAPGAGGAAGKTATG